MIALVMPHYIATPELSDLAYNAINSLRGPEVVLISVDDGSPLDTKFLSLSDKVIRLEYNQGFAKACNVGLAWAINKGYKLIGCANNDIEVFPGWYEALTFPFSKWDDVGFSGLISSKQRIIDNTAIENYIVPKITSGGLLNHWMMSGGLWLSSNKALSDIGLFDERFEVGGEEDVDLFLRAFKEGYQLIMSGYSCFWHKEGATRWNEELPGFKERNKAIEQDNYARFADKWGWDIREEGLKFHEEVLDY